MKKAFSKEKWSYLFYTLSHPMDGFYWIRHQDRGSVPIAILMVILFSLCYSLNRISANFIVNDVEPGEIITGKVVRIMNFGAFVELAPNKDGLIHISKLSQKRVAKVEDVVNIGDEVTVKVLEIDRMGRINLSMKDVPQEEKQTEE